VRRSRLSTALTLLHPRCHILILLRLIFNTTPHLPPLSCRYRRRRLSTALTLLHPIRIITSTPHGVCEREREREGHRERERERGREREKEREGKREREWAEGVR